jgi:hypothetical protein
MKRAIGSIGLLSLIACGGSGNPNLAASPGSCSGQQVASISNDWTAAVDVFARAGTTGEPRSLGTLQPGLRQDFPVPPGTTEVYVLQEGRTEPNAVSRNLKSFVNIRFQCR